MSGATSVAPIVTSDETDVEFLCQTCGEPVEKRAMMFFTSIPLAKDRCANCGTRFRPTTDAKIAVVAMYFFLPFLILSISTLALMVVVGEAAAPWVGFTFCVVWIVWLCGGMPARIKRGWRNYTFVWTPRR